MKLSSVQYCVTDGHNVWEGTQEEIVNQVFTWRLDAEQGNKLIAKAKYYNEKLYCRYGSVEDHGANGYTKEEMYVDAVKVLFKDLINFGYRTYRATQ